MRNFNLLFPSNAFLSKNDRGRIQTRPNSPNYRTFRRFSEKSYRSSSLFFRRVKIKDPRRGSALFCRSIEPRSRNSFATRGLRVTRVGMWARPLTLPGVFVRRRNFVSGATARTKFHFSRSRDESKEREREEGREERRERERGIERGRWRGSGRGRSHLANFHAVPS